MSVASLVSRGALLLQGNKELLPFDAGRMKEDHRDSHDGRSLIHSGARVT